MNAGDTPRGREVFRSEHDRCLADHNSRPSPPSAHHRFSFGDLWDETIDAIASSPWPAHSGSHPFHEDHRARAPKAPLYTPEERRRRDSSPWTLVQGVLAPLQFVAFAISLALVLRYLATGRGYEIATASILIKTVALYTIMITGSIWEKEVFGRWLFAAAFFWEDVFSMLVLGLQTAYLAALITGWGDAQAADADRRRRLCGLRHQRHSISSSSCAPPASREHRHRSLAIPRKPAREA